MLAARRRIRKPRRSRRSRRPLPGARKGYDGGVRLFGGLLACLSLAGSVHGADPDREARISLDLKEAPVGDVLRLLADVADFQVVMDPGVTCAPTLKLNGVRWQTALDLTLRSCGLAREEEGGVIRVAPAARLLEESAARRRLEEERKASAPRSLRTFRLSYARAEQVAPLLKRWLSPRAEINYDSRTNTLIVVD